MTIRQLQQRSNAIRSAASRSYIDARLSGAFRRSALARCERRESDAEIREALKAIGVEVRS